jgi:hypothetical protein
MNRFPDFTRKKSDSDAPQLDTSSMVATLKEKKTMGLFI